MTKHISNIVRQNKEVVCYLVETIARKGSATLMDVPTEVTCILEENAWTLTPEQAHVYKIELHNGADNFQGRILANGEHDAKRLDILKVARRIETGLFFEILFYVDGVAHCQIYPKEYARPDEEVDRLFETIGITVGPTTHDQALAFMCKIHSYQAK